MANIMPDDPDDAIPRADASKTDVFDLEENMYRRMKVLGQQIGEKDPEIDQPPSIARFLHEPQQRPAVQDIVNVRDLLASDALSAVPEISVSEEAAETEHAQTEPEEAAEPIRRPPPRRPPPRPGTLPRATTVKPGDNVEEKPEPDAEKTRLMPPAEETRLMPPEPPPEPRSRINTPTAKLRRVLKDLPRPPKR